MLGAQQTEFTINVIQ